MQGQFYLAKTPDQVRERCNNFADWIIENWTDYPVCWKPEKYKPGRSLDQNALFQIWAREYAAHLLKVKKPTAAQHNAMRITLQRHCYAATGWQFLVESVPDLFTGQEKPGRTSTTDFNKGDFYSFMCWIQQRAAEDGLTLVSQGEYQKLQGAENDRG